MGIRVIYPGTFDPITLGHQDVAERAAKLFDEVVIALSVGTGKKPMFSFDERMELSIKTLAHLPNVSITSYQGLTVDFAKTHDATAIIRGLRAEPDFEYEFQLAGMNASLAPDIETVFLPTATKYTHISSTLVREIASLNGDISQFVDPIVAEALQAKVKERQAEKANAT
ncbi:MAG: pantetheine-phosphate adenylyltransferase [Pseudomonadota bacterium]